MTETGADAVRVEVGVDAGAVWHYGDPMREQRELAAGRGAVDLSHHDVVSISGPDRLTWLHSLTTQHLSDLAPGASTTALILSPQGHIEFVLYGVDDGSTFWVRTEPRRGEDLAKFLTTMRFMMQVEVTVRPEYAVVWRPGAPEMGSSAATEIVRQHEDSLAGFEIFLPRTSLDQSLGGQRAGVWAYEARRIAAGVPRIGIDSDHRTLPNELGVLGVAVHLDKGCYRGQETVARVHTLGRPPRRLVRLQLDGSGDSLPEVGAELTLDGRAVGFVGSSERHYEQGPIALALVKRSVPVEATLVCGEIAAAQEIIVDPEVGLHVRPQLN